MDEDSATHVWYLWWFRWAFIEGHSPLFQTDWIFHPQVIDRIFDVHTFTNALISLPIQYLWNPIVANNLLFYLNFFLSGLGAFLLARKLTGSPLSAFLAGLVFVFMPYTWGQMLDNHTNLYTIWFIPFYLLFLIKTLEEKSWLSPILAGVIFGLQALNDLTLTTFMITATLVVGFYYLVFYHRYFFTWNKKLTLVWPTIFRLVVLGLVFIVIFAPYALPTIKAIQAGQDPGSTLADQQVWVAQIPSFFFTNGNNPLLVPFSRVGNVNAIEGSAYIGLTAVALSLLALTAFIKKPTTRKYLGLSLVLFLAFLVLSLGPCAKGWGINLNLSFCEGLPMPFVFFHLLPLIGGIQEPIRMHIYTMTAVSLLVAFGSAYLLQILKSKWPGVIVVVLGILMLVEYYTPLPLTDLTPPTIYQTISQEAGDFAVLSLPVGWNNQSLNTGFSPIGSLQYFQAIHEKKAFRATVARIPHQHIQYYLDKPLFKYLVQPNQRVPDTDDLDTNLAKKTFSDFHIRYIVVHKDKYELKKAGVGDSLKLIETVLGGKKIWEEGTVVAYQIP